MENKVKTVINSSLPAIIRKEQTSLEKSENAEKFCVGPTTLKPGPTLPIQVAAAEKQLIKSKLSRESSSVPANITTIYVNKKLVILITTSDGSSDLFNVM